MNRSPGPTFPPCKRKAGSPRRTFTYFAGSHNGYARLKDSVVHRRHILKIAGSVYLVREIALGRGEHQLDIRWHFAPDLEVQAVSPRRIEISRQGAQPGESRLSLIVPEDVPDETVWHTIDAGYENSALSRLRRIAACSARQSSARLSLPAETATALLSGAIQIQQNIEIHQNNAPLIAPHMASIAQPNVQLYELDYHGRKPCILFRAQPCQ